MPDLCAPAETGFHVPFIKSRVPDWTRHLANQHLQAITEARNPAQRFIKAYPELYDKAAQALRQALLDSQAQSNVSSQALATTLKDFKGITEFAKPLLTDALQKKFGQAPDVDGTALFHLRSPNRAEEQSLLQAALRNFEADEAFDEVALQETSALAPAGALDRHFTMRAIGTRLRRCATASVTSWRYRHQRSPACAGNWTWASSTRTI